MVTLFLQDVLYHTEVGDSDMYPQGEEGVVYFQRPGSTVWQPLTDIASRVGTSCYPNWFCSVYLE